MGAEDVNASSRSNVYRMKLPRCRSDTRHVWFQTLKDAMNEAWRGRCATGFNQSLMNTSTQWQPLQASHPIPQLVRAFQCVIGREARAQCLGAVWQLH